MTGEKDAPAEMPGVEEIARVIASWRHRSTPANPYRPSILPSEMAQASAILALFAPILAEKEREIERLQDIRDRRGCKIIELSARALAAEAKCDALREALDESYSTLALAFGRIHGLPRTSDSELARRIGETRARIERARALTQETNDGQ